jgi:hypothetical protein
MMCPGVAGPNRATGPVRIFHAILKAALRAATYGRPRAAQHRWSGQIWLTRSMTHDADPHTSLREICLASK